MSLATPQTLLKWPAARVLGWGGEDVASSTCLQLVLLSLLLMLVRWRQSSPFQAACFTVVLLSQRFVYYFCVHTHRTRTCGDKFCARIIYFSWHKGQQAEQQQQQQQWALLVLADNNSDRINCVSSSDAKLHEMMQFPDVSLNFQKNIAYLCGLAANKTQQGQTKTQTTQKRQQN